MKLAKSLRESTRSLIVTHGVLEPFKRPCQATISMPHAYALLEMLNHQEPMTISMLASRMAIDRTNVSRLCSKMEAAGEVTRSPDPVDARARRISLTPQGRKLAQSIDDSSSQHFQKLVEILGDDALGVIASLETLTNAMSKLQHSSQPLTLENKS